MLRQVIFGSSHLGVNSLAASIAQEQGKSALAMTLSEQVIAYFEQFRIPVLRFLMRKTRDTGRAEELTQETFLRLCSHLQQGRTLDNPKAWLFTVANNLAIDTGRSEGHLTDLDEYTWKQIEDSRSDPHADPERLLLQDERLERLHTAVLNLTPLQRECLHLRAEGLRYREIAELMDISISTVADAVRRATIRLAVEVDSEASA